MARHLPQENPSPPVNNVMLLLADEYNTISPYALNFHNNNTFRGSHMISSSTTKTQSMLADEINRECRSRLESEELKKFDEIEGKIGEN